MEKPLPKIILLKSLIDLLLFLFSYTGISALGTGKSMQKYGFPAFTDVPG